MTVWVLQEAHYDYSNVIGVFSSLSAAEEQKETLSHTRLYMIIEKFMVDIPEPIEDDV